MVHLVETQEKPHLKNGAKLSIKGNLDALYMIWQNADLKSIKPYAAYNPNYSICEEAEACDP